VFIILFYSAIQFAYPHLSGASFSCPVLVCSSNQLPAFIVIQAAGIDLFQTCPSERLIPVRISAFLKILQLSAQPHDSNGKKKKRKKVLQKPKSFFYI
jgi:hypothetical protein